MQQRFWSYSSRAPEDHATVTIDSSAAPPQAHLKHHHHNNTTPRARVDDIQDGLPVYYSGVGKKEGSSTSVSAEKWVHIIPLVVLVCLFVLWWFSVSVKVENQIGATITGFTATRETEIPRSLNETHIDIAILAATTAMSPTAFVPQNQTVNNVAEGPTSKGSGVSKY